MPLDRAVDAMRDGAIDTEPIEDTDSTPIAPQNGVQRVLGGNDDSVGQDDLSGKKQRRKK